jgi:hypothetical protein
VSEDPSARVATWIREAPNLHNTKSHCGFFGSGFRSSNRRQYSEFLLRNLRVVSLRIVCVGEGDYRVAKRSSDRLFPPLLVANFTTVLYASNDTLKGSEQSLQSVVSRPQYAHHLSLEPERINSASISTVQDFKGRMIQSLHCVRNMPGRFLSEEVWKNQLTSSSRNNIKS